METAVLFRLKSNKIPLGVAAWSYHQRKQKKKACNEMIFIEFEIYRKILSHFHGKIDMQSETKAVYSFGCIVHLSGLSLPADLKY